jgi:acetyl esterase/lipase
MIKSFLCSAGVILACAATGSAQNAPQLPAITAIATPAQPDAIPLYAAPKAGAAGEQWETFGNGRIVRNVVDPTLTPVLPAASKATGAAVIVAPGGGFLMLSMDSEGYAVAHWLADHGIAAFVLKYRLNESPRDPNEYLVALLKLLQGASGDHAPPGTPAAALEDAQAAMRMVRSRATEWKINPSRVGFVGFSAGAALTLSIGIEPDHAVRPDFIAPIYGPLGPITVPSDAPPMFTAVAADDPLFGKSRFELVTQWRAAQRPVEFHYFEKGGHGFGMNQQGTTSDMWIEEFYAWMKDRGLL